MHPRSTPRRTSAAFSQLELTCAVVFLMVAILGFSRTLVSSMHLTDAMRERAQATEAARRILEEMQDADFAQVFRLYNANPADDPGVAGTAPGATFVVAGLNPPASGNGGPVGAIQFPVQGTQLRENVNVPGLGMPSDLNADGVVDALDHAGDYQLLPVLVRVTWEGQGSLMVLELRTILSDR